MDLFKGKTSQALQTAINRARMYDSSRPSEVNTDGTIKKGGDKFDLMKGGEGSKGGKVIGHTQSGKPIYEKHDHESHSKFTSSDHMDAMLAHSKEKYKISHKLLHEDYADDKERKGLQKQKKLHQSGEEHHTNAGYRMTR